MRDDGESAYRDTVSQVTDNGLELKTLEMVVDLQPHIALSALTAAVKVEKSLKFLGSSIIGTDRHARLPHRASIQPQARHQDRQIPGQVQAEARPSSSA